MNNQYYILRHGKSLRNKKNIASCWPEKPPQPLTREGKRQIKKAARKLKKNKIDLIFSSDLLRTKQTANIVGKDLGIKPKLDKRLREVNVGVLNGKKINKISEYWFNEKKLLPLEYTKRRFKIPAPKGESYSNVEKRALNFLKEIDKRYKGKNILIVSHQRPLTLLEKSLYNYSLKKFTDIIQNKKEIKTGEIRKIKWK